MAVDSEQHVAWVQARWGVELEGGEGFRAIAELVDRIIASLTPAAGDYETPGPGAR